MTERLLLLDTASLYFRAFHGVPDTVRSPDGTPINAVRGLLDMIARLITEFEPTALVACWDDAWRPRWRVDLIGTYKEHRVATHVPDGVDIELVPEELVRQIPMIRRALDAFGIVVLGAEDHEADDVIGSLASQAKGAVDVVTGDRDLFQLVDDARQARVIYTARGMSRLEIVTDEVVHSKYGITSRQYVDFAVLRGDPSDGLPGVAGIGDKTAMSLLSEFGDLPSLLAAADNPTSRLGAQARKKLLAASEYLAVAPRVVTVVPDLDLGDVDATLHPLSDEAREAVALLTEEWGLGSSAKRLSAAIDGA